MDALLYFLFWGGLIFLMMRFGCGAHAMGHGHGSHNEKPAQPTSGPVRWIAPKADRDPVCGKTVQTDHAKSSIHDGMVYYFCSRECREIFEAAPHLYVDGGSKETLDTLERAHG